MITEIRRTQLLAGFALEQIAAGEKPRWTDVRSAPLWAQNRIVEIRAALADNKPVPPPSREYIQAAERRAAAATTFQRGAARFHPIMPSAAELADACLRAKAEAQANIIRADQLRQDLGLD